MVYKWVKIENEKDETYISGKILFWHGYKKYRGLNHGLSDNKKLHTGG